jgi:hypothetical protein
MIDAAGIERRSDTPTREPHSERKHMRRLPPAALITIGIVLSLFALLGLTNAEHTSAKIVYAILLPVAIGTAVQGFRKRRRDGTKP